MVQTRPERMLCLRIVGVAVVVWVLAPFSLARGEVAEPHGVAVIIGNKEYEHRDVPEVSFAHRDAQAFRGYVVDVLGYDPRNVVDLRDATRSEMQRVLGSPDTAMNDIQARLNLLASEGGSDVVVFYSGHGVPGKDGGASLLPADVPPHRAQSEGYPLALLYERLGALRHTRTVRVFIDACFSGSSDGGRLVAASPVYQEPAFPDEVTDNMVILTAVTGTQLATWDEKERHGLFTHHLLDALYGKGDADGDGGVTAQEAKGYLDRHMTSYAWLLNEREQEAVLTTRGLSGLVLASAGEGGVFPQRPTLDGGAPPADGGGEAAEEGGGGDAEEEDARGGLESAQVEEEGLGLSRAQRVLVQKGLGLLGYAVGRADGVFGERTRGGIVAYQKGKGLEETGYLTKEQAEGLKALGEEAEAEAAAAEAERRRLAEVARKEAEARAARERAEAERRRLAEAERKAAEAKAARERAETERKKREAGHRFRDCVGCPELVVVASGSYRMGSPSGEAGRDDDEGPVHRVSIGEAFAVGVYEVTFEEWDACVRDGGCGGYRPDDEGWGRGRRPVINVSWEDAKAYVRWLSRKTGKGYRLLSESEWEYVARGGTRSARYWGEGERGQCRNANGADEAGKRQYSDWTIASCDDGYVHTSPVGSFEANGFGLHDVLGNVWEWVEDCWNESYEGAPRDGSAWTRGKCGARVLRGGSWYDEPWYLRSAFRGWDSTGNRDIFAGFRIVRTL